MSTNDKTSSLQKRLIANASCNILAMRQVWQVFIQKKHVYQSLFKFIPKLIHPPITQALERFTTELFIRCYNLEKVNDYKK